MISRKYGLENSFISCNIMMYQHPYSTPQTLLFHIFPLQELRATLKLSINRFALPVKGSVMKTDRTSLGWYLQRAVALPQTVSSVLQRVSLRYPRMAASQILSMVSVCYLPKAF